MISASTARYFRSVKLMSLVFKEGEKRIILLSKRAGSCQSLKSARIVVIRNPMNMQLVPTFTKRFEIGAQKQTQQNALEHLCGSTPDPGPCQTVSQKSTNSPKIKKLQVGSCWVCQAV